MALVGYLAAVFTTFSVVPQIAHTLRTKDVRGISVPSLASLSFGIALWLTYGISIGSGPIIISNAITLALDVTILGLAIGLQEKRKTDV